MSEEYIRKADAVDLVDKISNLDLKAKGGIRVSLANLQKADVAPVVHGKWTKLFYDGFNCNKCGSTFVIMQGRNNMYYCPNCGAKMDAM